MNIFKKSSYVLFFLLAVFFALWLSSFIFRLSFMQLTIETLTAQEFHLPNNVRSYPFDIIHYAKGYYSHYPKQIEASFFVGFVAVFGLIGSVLYLIFRTPNQPLFGKSEFANKGNLKKANLIVKANPKISNGLFAGDSILIGKYGDEFLGFSGQQFFFLSAPTRQGKGVGAIIPNLLAYAHSIVVLDIKMENYYITSGYRKKCGHAIFLFNPFSTTGLTSRWNPFSYVSRNANVRVGDVNVIANSIVSESDSDKSDPFFIPAARTLFTGLTLYLMDLETESTKPTIKGVLDLASKIEGQFISYLQSLIDNPKISDITKQLLTTTASSGEKTGGNILTTLLTALEPWFIPTIAHATSADDFDLNDVRKKKMTIYIGIMPKYLVSARKIINLFFTQLINENTTTLPENDLSLKYQCLLMMDECTAAGKIEILTPAVGYMAGFNMRLMLITQTPSQLHKYYGKQDTQTLVDNMAVRAIYTSKPEQAAEYSKLLGDTTVKEITSFRVTKGFFTPTENTYTLNKRPLMLPQEFRELPFEKEIISSDFLTKPVKADKIIYYSDKVFKKRANLKPATFPHQLFAEIKSKPTRIDFTVLDNIFSKQSEKIVNAMFLKE